MRRNPDRHAGLELSGLKFAAVVCCPGDPNSIALTQPGIVSEGDGYAQPRRCLPQCHLDLGVFPTAIDRRRIFRSAALVARQGGVCVALVTLDAPSEDQPQE